MLKFSKFPNFPTTFFVRACTLPFIVHDKRACAIQAHALVAHMDGPAGVEGVPEDMVVAVQERLAAAVLIDIGPYGTAHGVGTASIPGYIGQGAEEHAALASRPVQQLVQASGVE